jgi:hypothetical protein
MASAAKATTAFQVVGELSAGNTHGCPVRSQAAPATTAATSATTGYRWIDLPADTCTTFDKGTNGKEEVGPKTKRYQDD